MIQELLFRLYTITLYQYRIIYGNSTNLHISIFRQKSGSQNITIVTSQLEMTIFSIFKSHQNSQHTERKLPKHTLFDKLALNKISFSPPIHSDQFILSILFCISASAPVPPPRSCHPTEGNVYSMIRSIYTGHLLAQS